AFDDFDIQVIASYDESTTDLVIIDIEMPSGMQALEHVRARIPQDDPVPILALLGPDPQERLRALAKGARDFIAKPVEVTEVLTRVEAALETRFLQLQLLGDRARRIDFLVDDVARARTHSLEEIQMELLERFAQTADYRDSPEVGHRERVADLSGMIAAEMGFPAERADLIARAALLHDIGKIGIPESIWRKPDRLTPEEFEQVKEHTEIGAGILSEGRSPLLWLAEEIAHTHHEHWDGNGYLGLAGEAIPVAGRIVAIADAYDALTHDRPYREARSEEVALGELGRESGYHFDPKVVDAFLQVRATPEFRALYG
ncbi:MAG: HD domain-containing protein, partial [Actinobacteria bacterium]|nr:HD domain-containing protein [Actinomycetota bacterium]